MAKRVPELKNAQVGAGNCTRKQFGRGDRLASGGVILISGILVDLMFADPPKDQPLLRFDVTAAGANVSGIGGDVQPPKEVARFLKSPSWQEGRAKRGEVER
ncbi:hypothetical protein [Stieleria neptunia]|uniref:hypothetical protein n=1 Tax=Stieleria neptunia TaxID=2527979 RepID=UPI00119CA9FB|nr:hypothetical protein [Stieleria neptunia]